MELCQRVENARMQRKTKEVYEAVRKITGKQASRVRIIKDKNGKTLTDQKEVSNRWLEHFRQLYNPHTDTDETVFAELPVANSAPTECPCLLKAEIESAIMRLKKDKSPGMDNITAEEIQAAGQAGVEVLYHLCLRIWEEESFPQDWRKAVIVPLHKKNDTLCCDNYRGISLLSHCEKVMAKVILQRIQRRTEEILSVAQAGFRAKRSTIDQLFTL